MKSVRRVQTPNVFQMEATECGAASLAMVLLHHGCYVPLEQLRIDTGVTRDGCNAKNIVIGSRKYDMEAHGYLKEAEDLRHIRVPCILHWNFNHFVVLEGIKGNIVYINDPAIGHRRLTFQDLDECFTGVVLTFSKTKAFVKRKGQNVLAQYIKKHMTAQKRPVFGLFLLGLVLILPGLVVPVLSQVFIDEVLVKGKTDWSRMIVILMIAALAFQAGLTLYQSFIQEKLRMKVSMLSSHNLLHHMLRLPISFFNQRSLGDLVNRSSNNENVNDFLTGDLTSILLDLFVAAFYLMLLLKYSVLLTCISLFGVMINLLITVASRGRLSELMQKQQVDEGKLSGYVFSGISISETLKAAGIENSYVSRILGQQAKSAINNQRAARIQTTLSSLSGAIDGFTEILILLVGAILVIRGSMTAGMLVAFISLVGSLLAPIGKLIGFTQKTNEVRADLSRVEDVLKHRQDDSFLPREPSRTFDTKLDGYVDVLDLSFGYNPLDKPIINCFSLKLRSGETVALIGASGSGKSTIAKIISGLYNPWQGDVVFDGTPLREIPSYAFHASVTTVSQNITLFSGTVRENLTMWNENVLDEDLIRAAKDACIHDLITSKPGAYEYKLSEDAGNLSGGERQRLEIARALAGNPSVLILDEATSALDPITEKSIMDNIRKRGCSCIIVAHRLSAIRDCNEIIVLSKGNVVQRGTHSTLIEQDGLYRQLVRSM